MRPLSTLFFVTAVGLLAQDCRERVAAGEQALSRGDYRVAVDAFQKATGAVTNTVEDLGITYCVITRAAEVRALGGDFDEAERLRGLTEHGDLTPDLRARAMIVAARVKMFHGDYSRAEADLRQARQLLEREKGPALATVIALRGQILAAKGDTSGAVVASRELDALIKSAPPEARLLPVRLAMLAGRYEEAERALRAIQPQLPEN